MSRDMSGAPEAGGTRGFPDSAELKCCTECGEPFTSRGPAHTVCSTKCRMRKHRRLKAGKDVDPETRAKLDERTRLASATADEGAISIAKGLIAQELAPVVKESLTDAVLSSIADLVELTPLMVAALKDDLVAHDPVFDKDGEPVMDENGNQRIKIDTVRRGRAVALVAKYTLGSPGLAPQVEPSVTPVSVTFGELPRPDYEAAAERACDECKLMRPLPEFEGASTRCRECQSAITVAARGLAYHGGH